MAEKKNAPQTAKPLHEDHRARMRVRVERFGLESLAEHEALEYLLFYSIPRRDTNLLAHALIERFGSFAGVLDAGEQEPRTVPGIGPATARFLHDLGQTERYYRMNRGAPKKRLADTNALAEYLMPLFHGRTQENLLLLALDDRRRLLRTVWLSDGSAGGVEVSVRRIVAEAAGSGAALVVLAHNHPDGVVLPSREDILSTAQAARALALVEVRLLDHFIFGAEEWLSFRESGRMQNVLGGI